MEKDSVTLILEITKPRKVAWLKGSEVVEVSERFKMETDKTGLRHTLTIYDITLAEDTEFSVQIDDQKYGIVSCSAHLTVKGKTFKRG